MNAITYERFAFSWNRDQLEQLITAYQDVFSTSPWSEWKKCSCCKTKWGRELANEIPDLKCPTCGKQLSDYWPRDIVERDIRKELTMPDATCWLAMDEKNVIGFCWGYSLTPEELDTKLGITCGVPRNAAIAYQDEIGVLEKYRGQGIARNLFNHRLKDFLAAKLQFGFVRTKTLPPSVTYQWFTRIGYLQVAAYNDTDGRVVMAIALDALRTRDLEKLVSIYEGIRDQKPAGIHGH